MNFHELFLAILKHLVTLVTGQEPRGCHYPSIIAYHGQGHGPRVQRQATEASEHLRRIALAHDHQASVRQQIMAAQVQQKPDIRSYLWSAPCCTICLLMDC